MPNSLLIHVLIDIVGTSEEKKENRGMGDEAVCWIKELKW